MNKHGMIKLIVLVMLVAILIMIFSWIIFPLADTIIRIAGIVLLISLFSFVYFEVRKRLNNK